jgi:hypothetical protein
VDRKSSLDEVKGRNISSLYCDPNPHPSSIHAVSSHCPDCTNQHLKSRSLIIVMMSFVGENRGITA